MSIPDQAPGPRAAARPDQRTVPLRSDQVGRPPAGPRVDRAYVRAARLEQPRGPKFLMYAALTLMASGDAFGIYLTLLRLIRTDTQLVGVFTVALTLSAVAGAHEVGRLTRARREGRDGHPLWIAALATFWLTVGLGVAWLRITQPLAGRDAVAGLPSLQFGVLLLGLYLLTGGLAMTTAYRYGSVQAAELRALVNARKAAARDDLEHQFDAAQAAARAERLAAERSRFEDENSPDRNEAYGALLKTEASLRQARHEGDPQSTDELVRPPNRPRAI